MVSSNDKTCWCNCLSRDLLVPATAQLFEKKTDAQSEMSPRCDYCRHLQIEDLRNITHKHHNSLLQLKECAQSKSCDMCALFWESLNTSCLNTSIQNYLDGRQSDPVHLRDTTIFLQGYLTDMGYPERQVPMKWTEKSTVGISSGELSFSRVHGGVSVYAKPVVPMHSKPNSQESNSHKLSLHWCQASRLISENTDNQHIGTIAAKFLFSRLITNRHDPDLRQIQSIKWLRACRSSHKRCGGTSPQLMPTRIIDLGDSEGQERIRLKITGEEYGRYLALSYSWGDGVRHNVKLKRETLAAYQSFIPEHFMTRSHQEALQITRELGYRYLWIDALCIIQGDKEDWAAEALKIAQVYSNAELTIVAGRSDDSTKGFIQLIEEPLVQPQAIPYHRPTTEDTDGQDFGNCFLALDRSTHSGPIDERAWCFQEAVLSRRMLIYGIQQLSFKCREISMFEDGSNMLYEWSVGGRYDLSTPVAGQGFSQEDILNRWYMLTQEYSCRDMYDPTDVFAALAGVASRFYDALGCRYLAGLWEVDMHRALLWRSRRLWQGPHSRESLKKPISVRGPKGLCIDRAPSWSFLALQGPIKQKTTPLKIKEQVSGNATSISLKCEPTATNNSQWSPDDWSPRKVEYLGYCRLQVYGYIREVRCSNAHVRDLYPAGLPTKPKWSHSLPKLEQHAVLFEEPGNTKASTIVAMGTFDLANGEHEQLWCLCISEEEGIILEKHHENFKRLGVFIVEDAAWFSEAERQNITIV